MPTLLVTAHASLYGRWIVDDAAITFAYARSLATGNGVVVQPGAAPVEGYSNPAWTLLLAVGRGLGLFDNGAWFGIPDYVAFPKALAVICCAVMFGGLYTAARHLVPAWAALIAGVAGSIVAAVPSFVIWSFSGLENPLLAATVVWIAAIVVGAAAQGRLLELRVAMVCGSLAALAALTRPDGAIYVVAFPLAVLILARRPRRPALVAAAASVTASAIPYGVYLAWRWSMFNLLVANTAVAKAQGLPDLASLRTPALLVYYVGTVAAVYGFVVIVLALRRRAAGGEFVALLIPLALALTAITVLIPDWMQQYRFATPIWPLAALAVVAATALLWPLAARQGRRVLAGSLAVSAMVAGTVFAFQAAEFRADPTVPVCAVAQYSGWTINGYADIAGVREGTVVTPDVGGAALVGRLRILDLAGLTHTGLAQRTGAGDMAGLRDDIFAARPEFIETHHGWSTQTGIIDDPRLSSEYVEIRRTAPRDGTWVRRDLVAVAGALDQLKAFDLATRPAGNPYKLVDPLASCGDVLAVPGEPTG